METFGSLMIDRYRFYVELEMVRHPDMSEHTLVNDVFRHTLVDRDYYSRFFGRPSEAGDYDRGESVQVDRFARDNTYRDVILFEESEREYIELMKDRRKRMREV
jgi:hypothetical protein